MGFENESEARQMAESDQRQAAILAQEEFAYVRKESAVRFLLQLAEACSPAGHAACPNTVCGHSFKTKNQRQNEGELDMHSWNMQIHTISFACAQKHEFAQFLLDREETRRGEVSPPTSAPESEAPGVGSDDDPSSTQKMGGAKNPSSAHLTLGVAINRIG
jgi:hypothetical protein